MKTAPLMSKSSGDLPTNAPETSQSLRLYWAATGLFSTVFLGSAVFGLLDLDASKAEWIRLEYPWWTFFFLTAGKVVGIAVILSNRLPRVVKDFAFARFLYDLLLAGGAHLARSEVQVLLPIVVLGVWAWAFAMDSKRFPRDLRR
jgi:DoxX-like family